MMRREDTTYRQSGFCSQGAHPDVCVVPTQPNTSTLQFLLSLSMLVSCGGISTLAQENSDVTQ